MPVRLLAFLSLVVLSGAGHAASCSARSPAHTVALVELYTAHACTTCPPADQWLQSLGAQGFGLDRVAPVSLHVDARDYGGGSPSQAREAHINRQRRMTRLARAAMDYSPRVLLQGREFTGWGTPRFEDEVRRLASRPARADLALRLADGRVRVEAALRPGSGVRDPVIYLSSVAKKTLKDENRTLTEYIVLTWEGPFPAQPMERPVTPLPETETVDLGVAAFVQDRATGEVLQALILPPCPSP